MYTAMGKYPLTNILSGIIPSLLSIFLFCLQYDKCKQSVDQSHCPDAAITVNKLHRIAHSIFHTINLYFFNKNIIFHAYNKL